MGGGALRSGIDEAVGFGEDEGKCHACDDDGCARNVFWWVVVYRYVGSLLLPDWVVMVARIGWVLMRGAGDKERRNGKWTFCYELNGVYCVEQGQLVVLNKDAQ